MWVMANNVAAEAAEQRDGARWDRGVVEVAGVGMLVVYPADRVGEVVGQGAGCGVVKGELVGEPTAEAPNQSVHVVDAVARDIGGRRRAIEDDDEVGASDDEVFVRVVGVAGLSCVGDVHGFISPGWGSAR